MAVQPIQLPVPQPPSPEPRHVSYWAISIFSSRTFYLNAAAFLVTGSDMAEVTSVIPERFRGLFYAAVAIANLYLRTQTVRPAAFIAPGTTKAVAVTKINPPPPAAVQD